MKSTIHTTIEIPTGDSKEDINARKQIIWNYYQEWKTKNPSQKRYNLALKDYINIRYVSIDETCHQASKQYLSTLAVLQLDTVLTMARKYRVVIAKPNNKNQKQFNKLLWMRHELVGVGEVKLMVGVVRRTKEKVQYCITVIKATKKGSRNKNLLVLPQKAGGKSHLSDRPPRGLSESHT